MRNRIPTALASGALLLAACWALSSCNETNAVAQTSRGASVPYERTPSHYVQSGTTFDVKVADRISSETAQVGGAWNGTVVGDVSVQNGGRIPAGSQVAGVIVSAVPAVRGSRAMLELGIRSIRVNGHDQSVSAASEPVIAGSTRARNLGAIAGSAAAGALIGKAVGDGKNATVGGIIGGVAAAGVVASSKGYQVVLVEGTVMRFRVNETVALR